MTGLKTFYFVVILVLIAVSNYHVQLAADEIRDEGKQAAFQEFIKMAEDFEKQNNIDDAIEIYERIIKADPNRTRNSQHSIHGHKIMKKLHKSGRD